MQCKVDATHIGQPVTDFLNWVRALIPDDKFQVFKDLFRFPLHTSGVCGQVFDKLSRIFDGRNPAFNYQFITSEQRDDWEWYRQERMVEPNVWSSKGWEYFQTQINSILIVDLPSVQPEGDRYPAPYFYWLPIERVIDYAVADDDSGQMEWIIFRTLIDTETGEKIKAIAVYDDTSYRVFAVGKTDRELGELITEAPHDLTYCPARFFWNEPLDISIPDIKASPITPQLTALDELLKGHIELLHLKLYGSYPVYSGYEQKCDYSNEENGNYCSGGHLRDRGGRYLINPVNGGLVRCPACGHKRLTGPGSFIEVPVPFDSNSPDLRNPVQMLNADVASLQFNVAEEKRMEQAIITGCVGVDTELLNQEAVNEIQIGASFESQSGILNRVKKGFEAAQEWVDSTVCLLRYGNLFVSASVNYGTDFYLLTADTLRKSYQTAKQGGASEAELDAMQNQILETEYRTDPLQLQRMLILADLEPYRHFTRMEVRELYGSQLIGEQELLLKLNFAAFVRRFERENTNVIEFGTALEYPRKIETITNTFNNYVKELQQNRGAVAAQRSE